MSKNKINQLVKMEDLAAAYSALIGNRYNLSVDFNLKAKSQKEMAFMRATRQPYKISNIKAESMQIVMRFYIDCESKEKYLDDIQIITQLCGMNKMLFESNSLQYKAYSFLDFAEPLNDPVIDCGRWHTTVELRGTILVTQLEGGVLIGNEVETKIRVDIGKQTEMEAPIEVLATNTTLIKTQETPQMSNAIVAKGYNQTQAYSYSYTCLMLKNAICLRLLKAIKNIQPFGLNEEIQIMETYPEFVKNGGQIVDVKSLNLTGSSIDRQAGAFVTFNMTFQDRLALEGLTVEDEEEQESGSSGSGSASSSAVQPSQQVTTITGNPFSSFNCSILITFNNDGQSMILSNFYIEQAFVQASEDSSLSAYISENIVSSSALFGIIRTNPASEVYEEAEDEVYTITFTNPFEWSSACKLILKGAEEVGDSVYFYDINNHVYATTEDEGHDLKTFNIPNGTYINKLVIDGAFSGLDNAIYLTIG